MHARCPPIDDLDKKRNSLLHADLNDLKDEKRSNTQGGF